ncbi:hypothetical protein M5K25_000227 [Dendrobium thyrsiflorum]|uniref:Uncharacterized protein n=1 Tax=Dendrobium thyrsiflorum TaxID=117978 RepID=A0ABD0VTC5_DENTH
MSATNLFQPPSSSAFFAGTKTSKPTHQSSSRKLSFSPIHPTPLSSLSSLHHRPSQHLPPMSFLASHQIRCGLRSLLSPIRAAGEPLSAAEEDDGDLTAVDTLHDFLMRVGEVLSIAFPLWMSLGCLVVLWKSPSFFWVGRSWQIVRLKLTMLGMGMTLTQDDLRAGS